MNYYIYLFDLDSGHHSRYKNCLKLRLIDSFLFLFDTYCFD